MAMKRYHHDGALGALPQQRVPDIRGHLLQEHQLLGALVYTISKIEDNAANNAEECEVCADYCRRSGIEAWQ
jgi:hypothetical protein